MFSSVPALQPTSSSNLLLHFFSSSTKISFETLDRNCWSLLSCLLVLIGSSPTDPYQTASLLVVSTIIFGSPFLLSDVFWSSETCFRESIEALELASH